MRVYLDGEYLGEMDSDQVIQLVEEDQLNVLVNKTNGYSHDWQAVEKFDKEKHLTGRIYLTKNKEDGMVQGTSTVSFS